MAFLFDWQNSSRAVVKHETSLPTPLVNAVAGLEYCRCFKTKFLFWNSDGIGPDGRDKDLRKSDWVWVRLSKATPFVPLILITVICL